MWHSIPQNVAKELCNIICLVIYDNMIETDKKMKFKNWCEMKNNPIFTINKGLQYASSFKFGTFISVEVWLLHKKIGGPNQHACDDAYSSF